MSLFAVGTPIKDIAMPSVGFVVYPDFVVIGLGCLAVFDCANRAFGSEFYKVRLLSEDGGPIAASLGITVTTERFSIQELDTLILAGGVHSAAPKDEGIVAYLQAMAPHVRRIGAICTGALHLADAGLLDGKKATTHWAAASRMQTKFPDVKVNADCIYVVDGKTWTSAGMTAGFDMLLAMVEADLGHELAKEVARLLVMYNYRSGGQLQFSALLEMDPKSDRVQSALAYAKENLSSPLSIEELAAVVNLSPRQFSRVFRAETGQTPAKAIETLRAEAARLMLEDGRHPVDFVARECGFVDRERMRQAFQRAFRQPPQVSRRNARVGSSELLPRVDGPAAQSHDRSMNHEIAT
jgi:transcriptional regulator GlxA family with amidase domain